MKITTLSLVLLMSISIQAQDVIGIWKSVDDTDGVEKSHIEIYEQDGKIYGKVIKLLEAATITTCEKCKGEQKGASLVGMVILRDLQFEDGKWVGGRILDPAKGKEYKCQISLESDEKLKLRGYIGRPLFGRTQYWYRVS